jgi:MFS family permease
MVELKKEEIKKRAKAREVSIVEGSAYSVMDGFGLRNITSYAVALNASNFVIGMLNSLPSLVGNVAQIFSNQLLEKYPRKRIVEFFVFLQALMWLFLILPGVLYLLSLERISGGLLVLIYTLLITFGASGGPAWSSWMKDLIDDKSGSYFAKRGKIINIIALVSMLVGGFVLDYFKQTNVFVGFFILFFFSFVARSISGLMFSKQYEPKLKLDKDKKYYFSFIDFIKKMHKNNFGRFVIFVAGITFATQLASPFFAVFMLKELNFTYSTFFLVSLASVLATILSMSSWGKVVDKYGDVKILRVSGIFIFIIPLMWICSIFLPTSFVIPYLFFAEFFSGFVWAGFNLAAGNFIYTVVTRERVALCSSYFNMLNGLGVFLGAALGGILASSNIHIVGSALIGLFLISAIARAIFYFALYKTFTENKKVEGFKFHEFAKEVFFLNPFKLFRSFDLHDTKPELVE